MLLLSALLIVAGAAAIAWWAVGQLTAHPGRAGASQTGGLEQARLLQLMTLFAPGIAAAATDPRTLLAWQPLAATARRLFPQEFAALDRAAGATFPFPSEQLQAAHARWTADWLAWERTHDATYKVKTSAAEADLIAAGGAPHVKARLQDLEREKLDIYQQRYEEYVRIGKALHALTTPPTTA